jgi:D-glycero-D-manno-heptose 1,7-bisphosphate phosphatase
VSRTTAAVVLDRDGTLIEHIPYLSDPKRVTLLPGVREGIRRAIEAGSRLFLHTNQSGIGRGLFELKEVELCNERMIELLGFGSNVFHRICIAPEHPDAPSKYRKPSPEFAFEIMREMNLAPENVCYIGDRATDLQTALAANTRAVGVCTGRVDLEKELQELGLVEKYPVCRSFDRAMALALAEQC